MNVGLGIFVGAIQVIAQLLFNAMPGDEYRYYIKKRLLELCVFKAGIPVIR